MTFYLSIILPSMIYWKCTAIITGISPDIDKENPDAEEKRKTVV
jgi:hypothetical protein